MADNRIRLLPLGFTRLFRKGLGKLLRIITYPIGFLLAMLASDRIVMSVMRRLRTRRKRDLTTRGKRLASNSHAIMGRVGRISLNEGFIEDQQNYHAIPFGSSNAAASGCGAIAVYNCLDPAVRTPSRFAEILDRLENGGTVLDGKLGTDITSMRELLDEMGMSTRMLRFRDKTNDGLAKAIVLVMNNRYNIFDGMHYIVLEKRPSGYWIHNGTGMKAMGPFPDYRTAVRKSGTRKVRPIAMLEVDRAL